MVKKQLETVKIILEFLTLDEGLKLDNEFF